MKLKSKIKISNNIKKIFILTGKNIIKKKNIDFFIKYSFQKKQLKVYKKKNFLPDINELKCNNKCLISNEFLDKKSIDTKNVIKLDCGHSFKYDCFLNS